MTVRGFTLLELTVVLVIAGVLLAIGLPRFALSRDRSAARSAVADLGATFSTARNAAMLRRSNVAIVLDTVHGMVEVHADGGLILRRSLRAQYGIALGSNRDSAVYDARGLGYGLSNLTVTVRHGAIVDTLSMSRLGRVRW